MILFDIGDNNNNANTHILLEAPKWFILSRHSILLMARNIDKTLWISRKKKRRTTATSTKKNVKKKLKKKMEKNYHIVRVHFAQLLTSFLQSNRVHVTNNKVFCSFSMKKKRNFFLSLFTLSFFRRTKPQDHIYAKSVRKYDQYYENGYSFARQIHTHIHVLRYETATNGIEFILYMKSIFVQYESINLSSIHSVGYVVLGLIY